MSSHLSCEEARELAPELALGTISGDDRAKLIRHIGSCPRCRRFVEELTQISDSVLLLAPEHEPPAGFESAVLEQFKTKMVRRKRAPWLVAASLVAIAVIATAATLWITAEDRRLGSHLRVALDEANGDYFGVKALRDETGAKVANVFSYGGRTSWVFVVWPEEPDPGRYDFMAQTRDGDVLLGSATLGERQTWGGEISTDLREITALHVSNRSGDEFVAQLADRD